MKEWISEQMSVNNIEVDCEQSLETENLDLK